jgi:hypothetical protein
VPTGERDPQNQGAPSQLDKERSAPRQEYEDRTKSGEDPDVFLDVPVLKVEEINLELKDLRAHVSLRADLANLVNVNVGVDAYLDEVKLEIKGVEAQALLKVRLDRVLDTFDRALETIDNNPEILGGLLGTGSTGESASNDAETPSQGGGASLGETTDEAGRTVQRSVDEAGDLVETTLDDSGAVTDEKVTGSLEDLSVEEEYVDDEGNVVSRARDEAGNIVEQTLDDEGNVVGINVPETPENAANEVEATTAAEKKARELGVDLSGVSGSGSGGRILVGDVEKAVQRRT